MLKGIMGNTLGSFKLKPTEIIKGDMIYCKNCGYPKLFKNEYFGYVRVACKCELEEDKAREKELQRKLQAEKFRALQENSQLGERYKNVSFDNTDLGDDTDKTFLIAFNRCKKYCDKYNEVSADGLGIYLYGGNGTGKSHLSACVVNKLSQMGIPTLFTNFFTLIDDIKKRKANVGLIATIPVLVFDDIGSEKVKFGEEDSWVQEIIFQIINQRYNEKKPTLFTSNCTIEELMIKKGFSKKTIDRIIGMASAVIKVDGKSYRLKNRKKELPF